MTLTATRLAVSELDGVLVGAGRAVVAAALSCVFLAGRPNAWPKRRHLRPLILTALGVVIGFPTLSTLALRSVPASHAQIFVGLSPLATAAFASLRRNERPSPKFWLTAALGGACVTWFGWTQAAGQLEWADTLLLCAVALVGLGYAEGGQLAKEVGGARVVCWAALVALPITLPLTMFAVGASSFSEVTWRGALGFVYVSTISMWLAFFAWYKGLAQGGIARGSQVQLLMPAIGMVWASLFLGETLDASTLLACAAVVASTGLHFSQMARNRAETPITLAARIQENESSARIT